MRTDNPCRGLERNREHPRQRYLSSEELVRLMTALDSYRDHRTAAIFELLLLTGARRGEVLRMKWSDVDLKTGIWVKSHANTKQKERHEVPLSAPARAVLSALLADADDPEGYIFPAGRGAGGPRRSVEKAWIAICKSARIEGLRTHDLRHSFASQAASQGIGLYTIGGLLGHKKASTTQRYSHLTSDHLREATERVGAIITGKPAADVVSLKRRAP
jgi:integrase